jgi:hypothetical protein
VQVRTKLNLSDINSKSALGPTQPPLQWVLVVKRLGREADHSLPSSVMVMNARSYTSTPPMCLHDVEIYLDGMVLP